MLYMLWEKEICKWHHDLSSHSFYFLHFIFKVHTLYSSLANTTEWFFIFLKRQAFINALFNQLMFCQVKKCLAWQDDTYSVRRCLDSTGPGTRAGTWLASGRALTLPGRWSLEPGLRQRTHEAQDVASLRRRWLESCQTDDQSEVWEKDCIF